MSNQTPNHSQPPPDDLDRDHQHEAIDQLASQWIDASALPVSDGKRPAGMGNISAADQARLAELSLVDVLLEYLHGSEHELATEQAVSSVLATIHDKSPHRGAAVSVGLHDRAGANARPANSKRRLIATLCASACLLLLVGGWALTHAPRHTVEATLLRFSQSTQISRDLIYHTEIESQFPFISEPVKRLATGYVRAGQRMLIVSNDGWFKFGNIGEECWLVPKTGPVQVGDADQLLPPWLLYGRQRLPFLHMHAMMSRASRLYDITMLEDSRVEDKIADPNLIRLLCTRQTSDGRFPSQIDAWVDAHTGIIRRMELFWKEPGTLHYLRRITFQYAGERDLPESFYRHESHHEPDRPVIRVNKLLQQSGP